MTGCQSVTFKHAWENKRHSRRTTTYASFFVTCAHGLSSDVLVDTLWRRRPEIRLSSRGAVTGTGSGTFIGMERRC